MSVALLTGDLIVIKFFCTSEGQTAVNVRHARITATDGGLYTDLQLAADLSNTFSEAYRNLLSTSATFFGAQVQITNPIVRIPQNSRMGSGLGEIGGDILPTQIAGLIKLSSNFAGRKGRGRIYIPFPGGQSSDESGEPTAAYIATLDTIGSLLIGTFLGAEGVNSATLEWLVSHRQDPIFRPVVSYISRVKWATQRRRSELNGGDAPPF